MRDKFDKKKLKRIVAVHQETWYAISKVKNDKRYAEYIDSISDEKIAEDIDMDTVLDELMEQGEVRGIVKVNQSGIKMSEAGKGE